MMQVVVVVVVFFFHPVGMTSGQKKSIDKGKMLFYNERYGAQEILQSYTLLFVNSVVYMKDEDINIMFEAKIKSNYKEI